MLYCFYFSDTEAFEACFRLLHDDDDDEVLPSVCLSARMSGKGVHCHHTVHFSADLSLRLDIVQCSGHPDTKACLPTPSRLFSIQPGRQVGYGLWIPGL